MPSESHFWMVRAGKGSSRAADFERTGYVGIGYRELGDFTGLTSLETVREHVAAGYADKTPTARSIQTGQIHKFRNVIKPGDRVVTYDGPAQEYLLGTITGEYEYRPEVLQGFPHVHSVRWEGRVRKAALRRTTINSFAPILTIFDPGLDALADVEEALSSGRTTAPGREGVEAPATDFRALFDEFLQGYRDTDVGRRHRQVYVESAAIGRENYQHVLDAEGKGEDITDLVLRTLLPHVNTKHARATGAWVHVAPAITKDIRSWYEGSGLATPDEWPAKARLLFNFIRRMVEHPDEAELACVEFSADREAKGFQSGMLTPILNALRPDKYAIVNSKVIKTIAALTHERLSAGIGDYPEVNARVRELAHDLVDEIPRGDGEDMTSVELFDMFSHWFVAVREEPELDEPETGDEQEDDEAAVAPPTDFDKSSPIDARRVVEGACPDPAPRAIAVAQLVRAVRLAHELAPAAWSVTMRPRSIRLNVGGIVAIDIRRSGLYLVAHEPTLGKDAARELEPYDQDIGFTYLSEVEGYRVPWRELDPAVTLLRPANDELVRKAIEKSARAPWRSAHSPGVLEYLRQLGHDVPDPEYERPRPPRPGGVSESLPKSPTTNPAVTLESIANELFIEARTVEKWLAAINRKGQAIIYGPPGTGKTFVAERLARYLVGGGDGRSDLVQFHPTYSYEDFIQGLRPRATSTGTLTYEMLPGRFKEFCQLVEGRNGVSVLIIDEINRANLSSVFGELMYLLEYREREVPLSGGGRLRIPPNVKIIGTMNTADRSIALVDHALRRRFAFIRLEPRLDVLQRFHEVRGREVSGLVSVLEQVNNTINDPHYSVGISFFMRDSLAEDLEAIWIGEIEPYLEELFFDRASAIDDLRWARVKERIAVGI